MSQHPSQSDIDVQVRELEELASDLRAGELTPERVKELADRALELAERVSVLAGGARGQDGSDAAGP